MLGLIWLLLVLQVLLLLLLQETPLSLQQAKE